MHRRFLWLVNTCLLSCLAAPSGCGGDTDSALGEGSQGVAREKIIADVPYRGQRGYPGIGESACAPTAIAMILKYYYPNSNIDVPEIYHAGLQSYHYNGPVLGYRNLSWGNGYTADPGNDAIPPGFQGYYDNLGNSAVRGNAAIQSYLNSIWGINTTIASTESALYSALADGPVIGHVWGHGNTHWGHYLVIRGIDDKGTASHADDTVYVNDPYDKWGNWDTGGNDKGISYHDFFVSAKYRSAWFRDAIAIMPQDTATQRQYTVVVDTGHNALSGNASHHRFQVDDMNDVVDGTSTSTWWMRYGSLGSWFYAKEANHAARWTPELASAGAYQVSVKFVASPESGTVQYHVYDAGSNELATVTVNQHSNTTQWAWSVIAPSVSISNGAYVRATDITASSSIGAVKFKYLQ